MTKTPEQLAVEWLKEEYGDTSNWTYMGQEMSLDAFYAGYQAAKDSAAIDTNSIDTGTKMQWISVKDRLPEYTPMVLAMCTDGYELAYYGIYGQGWANTLGTEHLNVTHWQPLPKSPEEK